MEYQGTTGQLCGLYPFVAGSGSPTLGVPIGRHMLWGEVVCLDPLEWLRAGLVTNPGVFVLGQPGAGKSTIVKRLDHRHDRLRRPAPSSWATPNPTTPASSNTWAGRSSASAAAWTASTRSTPARSARRCARMRADRGPATAAGDPRPPPVPAAGAVRPGARAAAVTNAEEIILGRAIDLLTERSHRDPTVPDVLRLIEAGADELRAAARARTDGEYRRRVDDLVPTLALLCEGTLRGVFDAPHHHPLDLDAPAVSVDISRVAAAGDKLVTAAMLCVWAYGYAMVDAAAVLADHGLAPRRQLPGRHGRTVAGAARRARPGRARRRAHPAQPGQRHGLDHGHPLPGRPRRAAHRRRPGQGARLRRTLRHQRPRRAAAPRTRPRPRRSSRSPTPNGTWSPPGPRPNPGSPAPPTPAAAST